LNIAPRNRFMSANGRSRGGGSLFDDELAQPPRPRSLAAEWRREPCFGLGEVEYGE
jgi:hypothetical protein